MDIIAQLAEIDAARAHDLCGVCIIDQREKNMVERGAFLARRSAR